MIFDTLANASLYLPLHPAFEKAFAFLAESMKQTPAPGRYEIDGDRVYAMVQSYVTRDPASVRWEAHRKYADIQFLLSGRERIGCADAALMVEPGAYDPEKDILFADGVEACAELPLCRGSFAILYPQDAHRPGCVDRVPSDVTKIVVKILL